MIVGRSGGIAHFENARWKLLAFLGRYGHQPIDVCLKLPESDLRKLANGVANIMDEEAVAMRTPTDG